MYYFIAYAYHTAAGSGLGNYVEKFDQHPLHSAHTLADEIAKRNEFNLVIVVNAVPLPDFEPVEQG